MANVHEGRLDGGGKRVAIVASRFNEFLTRRLVDAAIDCLRKHGVESDAVDVYWVPGSFEISQLAMKLGQAQKIDGIVCLGTIIRGETHHFEILASSVIRSIADVSARSSMPVTYGIITADTVDQAMNRAGGKNGNKGRESALALIEMMTLWES
jgi:6,7-dimethyl-8-ribityllumazine synthase